MTSLGSGGNTLWALSDHLGTVRDIADLNETTGITAIANHRKYNSFGALVSETNSAVDLIYGYTGKQLDDSTNLQHNLNRWYDSALGQWISEDPIGFEAGDENLRRYVNNESTSLTDKLGLAPEPEGYQSGMTESEKREYKKWYFKDDMTMENIDRLLDGYAPKTREETEAEKMR